MNGPWRIKFFNLWSFLPRLLFVFCWLVNCFEDLPHFSARSANWAGAKRPRAKRAKQPGTISAISWLRRRRSPISEIVATGSGIKLLTSCYASQELNHSTYANHQGNKVKAWPRSSHAALSYITKQRFYIHAKKSQERAGNTCLL